MNVIDTNIWIYSHDTRDPGKQTAGQRRVNTLRPPDLPWQVGCEFIAASRKLIPNGFDESHAWAALGAMRAMADDILIPMPELWGECQALQQRYSLSFWDGLLVATCIRAGVHNL